MVTTTNLYDFELPDVDEWLAGDDRVLAFRVTDGDGEGIDISETELSWAMFERPYQTDAEAAILSDTDSGVSLTKTDAANGKWEVKISGEATSEIYGEYYHRPKAEQYDGTVASWRGEIVLTA